MDTERVGDDRAKVEVLRRVGAARKRELQNEAPVRVRGAPERLDGNVGEKREDDRGRRVEASAGDDDLVLSGSRDA